ncbi:zinc finger protein 583-like, partial [Zootermopsis nevadensis]
MKTYSRKKQSPRYDFDDTSMNFNEICRLCLSEEGEKVQIFEVVDEVPLPLKIMACVSVEVFEGDGLPSQICRQCTEELDSYYKFKQKCENSDARLRQRLKNIKTMQFQAKVPQTSSLIKGDEDEDSNEVDDLFTQQEEEEQEIINNIREDLENHKRNNVNSGPVDQSINYNVKTNVGERNNEREGAVRPTRSSENYMQSSFKRSANMTMLAVKHEQVESEHSNVATKQNQNLQSGDQNQGQQQSDAAVGSLPSISHLQHYTPQGLPFICTNCPKRFAKRIDLRRHESVHNQQRGFECPVCEKWFPNKTSFGRHQRTHTGERPFSCNHCAKSFSQGAILARHIMTHTGVKPFKCEICCKGFTQREGLRTHMRQHTNEQPEIQLHECPLCEKSFCHPSGLSRHLIIHTGKTFDCTICPKVFTDSSSLRRHMRRHGDTSESPLNQPP